MSVVGSVPSKNLVTKLMTLCSVISAPSSMTLSCPPAISMAVSRGTASSRPTNSRSRSLVSHCKHSHKEFNIIVIKCIVLCHLIELICITGLIYVPLYEILGYDSEYYDSSFLGCDTMYLSVISLLKIYIGS